MHFVRRRLQKTSKLSNRGSARCSTMRTYPGVLDASRAQLNGLRRNNVGFTWTPQRQKSYNDIKEAFAAQTLRVYFKDNRPLIMVTDASPYGVGTVLMQKHDDGFEHMVTCTSPTLSATERRYAQIEKVALSIVFGFKRFRQYVMDREVVMRSRFSLIPTMVYRKHRCIVFSDSPCISLTLATTSSRQAKQPSPRYFTLPQEVIEELDGEVNAALIEQMESGPSSVIGVFFVRQATNSYSLLARLVKFVQRSKPINCLNEDIQQYFIHCDEITVQDGVLMWGLRVVVPPPLQSEVLTLLYKSHIGCTRSKLIAQSYK